MMLPLTATRLRKAATDNGFDMEAPVEGNWLRFSSTKSQLRLWLTEHKDGQLLVGFTEQRIVDEMGHSLCDSVLKPPGATSILSVKDFEALHHLLRRGFQLSRALPLAPLHDFEKQTAQLPRGTEAERLVVQRVGQQIYRQGLIDYWEGCCAVTGLDLVTLLRASHSKPWADCESDAERLDVFNGFLLAPHLDALFDAGFITILRDGTIFFSPSIPESSRVRLGLASPLRVSRLTDNHRGYLAWHATHVFRKDVA